MTAPGFASKVRHHAEEALQKIEANGILA